MGYSFGSKRAEARRRFNREVTVNGGDHWVPPSRVATVPKVMEEYRPDKPTVPWPLLGWWLYFGAPRGRVVSRCGARRCCNPFHLADMGDVLVEEDTLENRRLIVRLMGRGLSKFEIKKRTGLAWTVILDTLRSV